MHETRNDGLVEALLAADPGIDPAVFAAPGCPEASEPFPSADPFADAGLPGDRAARIAARRAFVEMKQLFLFAAETIDDRKGPWLRHQVRQAHEPMDLWLLRGPLLASLRLGEEPSTRRLRAQLYRCLDSMFPADSGLAERTPAPARALPYSPVRAPARAPEPEIPPAWQVTVRHGTPSGYAPLMA